MLTTSVVDAAIAVTTPVSTIALAAMLMGCPERSTLERVASVIVPIEGLMP